MNELSRDIWGGKYSWTSEAFEEENIHEPDNMNLKG